MGEISLRQDHRPILSISLLASNRKDTTKKCLDSLKSIMDQVDSELVIVDTGCDEEMQALLSEYTDQVISFTWCDDFSKARNAGLEKCCGEWFLYIDDDEWFEDVSEIVNFFLSGEYKQYGFASYIIRNFRNYEGTVYRDAWVSRMVRMNKSLKFHSSIHEYFPEVEGPCKFLNSIADHYGYIYKTEAELMRHSKRNVKLLLNMLKKEKNNLRWWIHLAQEYINTKEYGKLTDLCMEGLQYFKRKDDSDTNRQRGTFYVGILKADIATFQFEEAKEHFDIAIKDERNTSLCKAMLFSQGTEIFMQLENYNQAKECSRKYIKLHESWMTKENRNIRKVLEGAFFTEDAFETNNRNSVYDSFIICTLKEKDTSVLKKYFDKLRNMEDKLQISPLLCESILDAFSTLEFDDFFVKIADQLVLAEQTVEYVLTYIQKKEEEDKEAFQNLLAIFSKVEVSNGYLLYLKLRAADQDDNQVEVQNTYKKIFGSIVDIFFLDESVWEIAQRRQIDLDTLFLEIPFTRWTQGVGLFCEKTNLTNLHKIEDIILKVKRTENIRYDYFFLYTQAASIAYGEGQDSYESLRKQLMEFCCRNIEFYQPIFQKRQFSGEMEFLPPMCQLAVKMKKVMEMEGQLDAKEIIRKYEECIAIFTPMDDVIRNYVKLYGEKEKEKLQAVLRRDSVKQILNLLDVVGEAIAYLKQTPNQELQEGVRMQRQNVESLIEKQLGVSVQERVDYRLLSDEEWLEEMEQVLKAV